MKDCVDGDAVLPPKKRGRKANAHTVNLDDDLTEIIAKEKRAASSAQAKTKGWAGISRGWGPITREID